MRDTTADQIYSRGIFTLCGQFQGQTKQQRQQTHPFRFCTRGFQSETEYHHVADETLEALMDGIEAVLEESSPLDGNEDNYEVNFAAGVLTIQIPPHGTWVINKQTPNQQLWWSSPLSGPKRFEYDDIQSMWLPTKEGKGLVDLLSEELSHILGETIELQV